MAIPPWLPPALALPRWLACFRWSLGSAPPLPLPLLLLVHRLHFAACCQLLMRLLLLLLLPRPVVVDTAA